MEKTAGGINAAWVFGRVLDWAKREPEFKTLRPPFVWYWDESSAAYCAINRGRRVRFTLDFENYSTPHAILSIDDEGQAIYIPPEVLRRAHDPDARPGPGIEMGANDGKK